METSSNFDRAAASKARIAEGRIQESNARVSARRAPAKNHYLTIALSFVLALSIGGAVFSHFMLVDARAELVKVEAWGNLDYAKKHEKQYKLAIVPVD